MHSTPSPMAGVVAPLTMPQDEMKEVTVVESTVTSFYDLNSLITFYLPVKVS